MNTIKLTRKELYEKVWSEPITRIAQKYGFSDVWLAKICRKNKVPRPPRGYWAIIQSGGKVPKTPLPKGDDGKLIEIIIHEPGLRKEKASEKERIHRKKISRKIMMPTDQTAPHRLVAETEKILSSALLGESGLIPPQKGCLNVHVSKNSLPRALLLMDNIVKVLSNTGYDVVVSEEATEVTIDGVSLRLTLFEELDTKRRVRAADHSLEGRYEFGYCLYEKKLFPSGRLCFLIEDPDVESPKKKQWRDSDLKKLEDCLKEFVLALIRMSVRKKSMLLEQGPNTPQEPQGI